MAYWSSHTRRNGFQFLQTLAQKNVIFQPKHQIYSFTCVDLPTVFYINVSSRAEFHDWRHFESLNIQTCISKHVSKMQEHILRLNLS